MTIASLRHRGGLAEHLNAASTCDNDFDIDDDHHETSSVATVRTTNRSSSKSRRFYCKAIVIFVFFELVLVAYYSWPRLAGTASKTPFTGIRGRGISTTTTSTGRSTGANLTSKIITASNREVRHGSLQQIIASHKQVHKDTAIVNAVSKRWLENDISGLTASDARRLIVFGAKGAVQSILNETVCAPESAVMLQRNNAKSIDEVIELLARKDEGEGKTKAMTFLSQLIYSAIHESQYGPARNEAMKQMNEKRDAIPFSLKCPEAKYLIFEGFTAPTGLGSHLRTRMAIPTLLTGLAHGRIVLYTKADERSPMTIVNCDRGDLQCSFLPMSPCLPSMEDVQSAMVVAKDWDNVLLNHKEQRVIKLSRVVERDFAAALKVGETGKLKIVENFFTPDQRKWRVDNLVTAVARIVANDLYDAPGKADDLAAAFRQIMEAEQFQSRVIVAAQLFITRPNRKTRSQIQKATSSSFPPDYDPKTALGIPLRGSDKCLKEQKCAHFGRLIEQAHKEFPMDNMRHLIVSSEDSKYLDDAVIWKVMNGKQSGLDLELIMNKDDVMQATGQLQYLPKSIPMEDIMTSTMTAWAFQLRAGLSFLNICSNSHRLFEGSIEFGCAVATAWKRQEVECNVVV